MGDLELPLGDKTIAFDLVQKALRKILSKNKFPVLLGGDHLITLPVIEEILKVFPDLHLIHIDAHTDLREDYLGEALSHSTVMRKILDIMDQRRLFQMGVRSGTKEEFQRAEKMGSLLPLKGPSLKNLVKRLKGKPVYLSLDLDVLDPGILPGVGTPEPGGLGFLELLSLLKSLQPLRLIGFDLVELTPDYDPTQVSSVTASVLLREMILNYVPPAR
jgi:agmatinase